MHVQGGQLETRAPIGRSRGKRPITLAAPVGSAPGRRTFRRRAPPSGRARSGGHPVNSPEERARSSGSRLPSATPPVRIRSRARSGLPGWIGRAPARRRTARPPPRGRGLGPLPPVEPLGRNSPLVPVLRRRETGRARRSPDAHRAGPLRGHGHPRVTASSQPRGRALLATAENELSTELRLSGPERTSGPGRLIVPEPGRMAGKAATVPPVAVTRLRYSTIRRTEPQEGKHDRDERHPIRPR